MSRLFHGIIIGDKNYPLVPAGFLSGFQKESLNSKYFLSKKTGFSSIVNLRRTLLNAKSDLDVKNKSSFQDRVREAGLGYKPFNIDIEFENKYSGLFKDKELMPHGPSFSLKSLKIVDNVKVPSKVNQYLDGDTTASDSVNELYGKGVNVEYLSQLMSTSNIGLNTNKKFVPTKWSITAVDDGVSNFIKKKDDRLSQPLFFQSDYLGNYFYILLIPGSWEFEFIEIIDGKVQSDYESVFGRKTYAKTTAGGYYATRLAVLEYLKRFKSSAKVIVVRDISDYYKFSLGVWVVREAVRKTLSFKPVKIDSMDSFENEAKIFISSSITDVVVDCFMNSKVLRNSKEQVSLNKFIKNRNI